jgi:poly(3-hydroxyalkanoate) synthetase
MKDLEIDNYLAEVIISIDDLGGRANLVGLCQGGWVAAMVAARFPDKINSLVLAGAPIDADAGDGPIKRMAHESQITFYEELVGLDGGLMKGKFMLQGWKNMHPEQHYIQDQIDLYEHIGDPADLKKEETFESWYETRSTCRGVPAGDEPIVQGKSACQGHVHRAGSLSSKMSLAPPICWRAQTMTL